MARVDSKAFKRKEKIRVEIAKITENARIGTEYQPVEESKIAGPDE